MAIVSRRNFLISTCAAAGALALGGDSAQAAVPKSPNGKPLDGVFPIGWTPCKPDGRLDADVMVRQMEFLNRGKVAGMAWPQNASGWQSLSAAEWTTGAEAIASVKGQTALVLGVQTTGFNIAHSESYARAAKRLKADGIISLMPPHASDADVIRYFKALSAASGLPMMVQAVGNTSIDSILALVNAVPSIVAIKDEAGDPLKGGPILIKRTRGRLEVFSGSGGYHFFPEMELGFTGTCPYTGLADLLQSCFDDFMAGRKRQAYDNFGRFLAFNSLPHANEYVMTARGVFSEDAVVRSNPGSGTRRGHPITAAQKAVIRNALDTYLKPYLVA